MGNNHKVSVHSNPAKALYSYTTSIWIILALAELSLQATRTVDISLNQELTVFYGEFATTIHRVRLRDWAAAARDPPGLAHFVPAREEEKQRHIAWHQQTHQY